MPTTFRTLGRNGTTITTRETHAPLTASTQQRLKGYVQSEEHWDDSLSALCAIWSIATLLSLDQNLSPAIRKALAIIMCTIEITEEIELAQHIGRPQQGGLMRLTDVVFGVLRRHRATLNSVRLSDGYWIMRVVEILENERADYKANKAESRKGIAARARTTILNAIGGRTAPLELIERALETRGPGSGKRLGSKWQRYLEVLNSLGHDRNSVDALKKMMRRHKAKESLR